MAVFVLMIGAHFPGRTVSGQRVLLIPQHGFVAHAVKIIVGCVIFADMVEAETKILALPQPTHRCTEFSQEPSIQGVDIVDRNGSPASVWRRGGF